VGVRAKMALRKEATFSAAWKLRNGGVPLGELFTIEFTAKRLCQK